jgi:Rps23 Pro-64 3,4-dihydroxylase Tpa1-like proline 4-hydroxylase
MVPALVGNDYYNPNARESLDLPGKWEVKRCFHMEVRKMIPKVAPRLHVPPFEIGDLEVKLRVYLDGHFFRAHMDCDPGFERAAYRQISYVYFFHKMPRAYTGGNLLLFDTDIDTNWFSTASFTSVVPEDNSIVFFPSAYWHSVVPISCPSKQFVDSRMVINGHVGKVAPKPAVQPAPEPADTDQGALPALATQA